MKNEAFQSKFSPRLDNNGSRVRWPQRIAVTSCTMSTVEPESAPERSIPPLPAIDTSPESWRFVASAFVVECLLWGQVFSSGIFLKYLATRPVSNKLCKSSAQSKSSCFNRRVALFRLVGNENLPHWFFIPAVWLWVCCLPSCSRSSLCISHCRLGRTSTDIPLQPVPAPYQAYTMARTGH